MTLFNRGRSNPELFPEVEKLRGDRDGGLGALAGRSWDAVVDTSGYFPRIVRASADALAASVAQYVFISTISVYADLSEPPTESSRLATLQDETVEEFGDEFVNYGGLKALCERAVEQVFGEHALVVRPGFIVGPHDPTERYVYWPRRVARGGTMLAPGPPERPMQVIDARDLAAWILRMVDGGIGGTFNATSPPIAMREYVEACPGEIEAAWAEDAFLAEHGVGEQDFPLWSPDPGFAALHDADVSKAVAAGLAFRPLADTARDTLEWDRARDDAKQSGLTAEREAELLAELSSLASGA